MHCATSPSTDGHGRRCIRFLTVPLIAATVLVMALPSFAVTAQYEGRFDRHEFAILIGGGYGRIAAGGESGVFAETSSTPDDVTAGMAFAIEYAYRSNRRLSLEAFLTNWRGTLAGELGNETWAISVIGGGIRWRPTGGGFYVRGGFGASAVMASLEDAGGDVERSDYTDYGIGAVGSLGYDFAVAGDFCAGPRLEVITLDVGDGVTASTLNALFAFTW